MPYDERDPDSGQLAPTYPDEDFVDAVDTLEPVGTKDVAEYVGCTRPAAYYRLKQLEEEGSVAQKKVGNTLIWTLRDTS